MIIGLNDEDKDSKNRNHNSSTISKKRLKKSKSPTHGKRKLRKKRSNSRGSKKAKQGYSNTKKDKDSVLEKDVNQAEQEKAKQKQSQEQKEAKEAENQEHNEAEDEFAFLSKPKQEEKVSEDDEFAFLSKEKKNEPPAETKPSQELQQGASPDAEPKPAMDEKEDTTPPKDKKYEDNLDNFEYGDTNMDGKIDEQEKKAMGQLDEGFKGVEDDSNNYFDSNIDYDGAPEKVQSNINDKIEKKTDIFQSADSLNKAPTIKNEQELDTVNMDFEKSKSSQLKTEKNDELDMGDFDEEFQDDEF